MEKRERILNSVIALSRDTRLNELNIREISVHSEVSIGTIYHYFSSKNEMLNSTFEFALARRKSALTKNDSKNDSVEKRLNRFWTNLFNYYVENPDMLHYLSQQAALNDVHTSEQKMKPLIKTIEHGIAQGDLRYIYPKVMFEIFISHVTSCAKMHVRGEANIGEAQVGFIRQTCWDSLKSIE